MKRNNHHSSKGAAAIEFAIILPLLITLLFGIIEFSILFYNKAMLTNAAREGARTGILYDFPDRISDDQIRSVVNSYLGSALITFGAASPVTTAITRSGTGTAAGDILTVTVGYHYDFLLLPNVVNTLSSGIDLRAVTAMRME